MYFPFSWSHQRNWALQHCRCTTLQPAHRRLPAEQKIGVDNDVFRQQKKDICLQEEYYRLKIGLLKNKSNDK